MAVTEARVQAAAKAPSARVRTEGPRWVTILGSTGSVGINTIDVVDQVKAHLASYRSQMPAAIKLDVTNHRSVSIRNAVSDVEFTLMLAAALVILVIFAFLKSLRATVIPVLALPVSLIANATTCLALSRFGLPGFQVFRAGYILNLTSPFSVNLNEFESRFFRI